MKNINETVDNTERMKNAYLIYSMNRSHRNKEEIEFDTNQMEKGEVVYDRSSTINPR